MEGSYDAVVVGAGVIGAAVAWRLAGRGLSVALVDPAPGAGASRVAAGMLAPVTEVHYGEEPLLRLNLAAAERYPSFVAELREAGGDPAYRESGTLAVALDRGDRDALAEVRAFQRSLGLEVTELSGRECRRLEPMLDPAVRGGTLVAGDHSVDPRRLHAALVAAGGRAGVQVVPRAVAEVRVVDGAVRGAVLDDGAHLAAPVVVVAAGSRSGLLPGLPGAARPDVRPVKGQVLRLRVPPAYRPLLSRTVRATVHGADVYLVPREDGELVVGATVEELGWDEQVTAGGVWQLLRDARALLPAVTELAFVEASAGLRPGSRDNAPVIGPAGVEGLVVATGHYRNGILLAPVTADAVAALVVDGALPPVAAPFAPAAREGVPA
ncbi:glycine oxidase ThiO [Vallicoccus soli]|uniref:glycine oxidase n=1 Tax=Vallicoccus soli TaxID=2339232 RepID=A0A3A3ZMG6_9ACTN|nr:glycine oxidase ThiO [Vallicoccus soli]